MTYGPYNNIPVSTNKAFLRSKQKRITIHYEYGNPILEVTKLERAAEISHWGSNLNIQDNVWLHNAGPKYVLAGPSLILALTTSLAGSKDNSLAWNFNPRTFTTVCPRIHLVQSLCTCHPGFTTFTSTI